MKFRLATIEDVPKMLELWYELMYYHADHHPAFRVSDGAEKLIEDGFKTRMKDARFRYFICEIDDEIAGFITSNFRVTHEAMIYKKKGYIAETVVSEKHRGKGIGKLLFEKAQEWFIEEDADHIELQVSIKNDNALNFWEKQGFSGMTWHMIKYLKSDL